MISGLAMNQKSENFILKNIDPLSSSALPFPLTRMFVPLGLLLWTVGTRVPKEDRDGWEPGKSSHQPEELGEYQSLGRKAHVSEHGGH